MNKNILTAVGITILFLGTCSNSSVAIDNVKKSSIPINSDNTLYVGGSGPNNYTLIQDAIDNASDGDTIFVFNGSYPNNVWIDKPIILIGEDKNNTIIEGGWLTSVIVDADDIIITGFTVRDCGFYYSGGIHICGKSSNVTIVDNILSDNIICGISISGNKNFILNNTIKGNYNGIKLAGNNNTIAGNTIDSNNWTGIFFVWIRGNGKSYDSIYQNNIIKENTIINNDEGIYVERCNNSVISNNFIAYNKWTGIYAPYNEPGDEYYPYKNNIKIENNTIVYNKYGIQFWDSNRTIISNNLIALNKRSIWLYNCNKSLVYHNNIVSNTKPPIDEKDYSGGYKNQWDNGYPSGGNFWSGYLGVDNYSGPDQNIPGSDGIGDIPYNISGNENSQDRYPLMEPWGGNHPPDVPKIEGPKKCKPGIEYNYTIVATDSDEDDIWYHLCWGDKEIIYIYGPYPSGKELTLSYKWTEKGTYTITCWARDIFDAVGNVSTLDVDIPRLRATSYLWFDWFLERFPFLERLLNLIF